MLYNIYYIYNFWSGWIAGHKSYQLSITKKYYNPESNFYYFIKSNINTKGEKNVKI